MSINDNWVCPNLNARGIACACLNSGDRCVVCGFELFGILIKTAQEMDRTTAQGGATMNLFVLMKDGETKHFEIAEFKEFTAEGYVEIQKQDGTKEQIQIKEITSIWTAGYKGFV